MEQSRKGFQLVVGGAEAAPGDANVVVMLPSAVVAAGAELMAAQVIDVDDSGGSRLPAGVVDFTRVRRGRGLPGWVGDGGGNDNGDGGSGESGPEKPNRAALMETIRQFTANYGDPYMSKEEPNIVEAAVQLFDDDSWSVTDEQPEGKEIGIAASARVNVGGDYEVTFSATRLNEEAEELADRIAEHEDSPASVSFVIDVKSRTPTLRAITDGIVQEFEMTVFVPKDGFTTWIMAAMPSPTDIYTEAMADILDELGVDEALKFAAAQSRDFELEAHDDEEMLGLANAFMRKYFKQYLDPVPSDK